MVSFYCLGMFADRSQVLQSIDGYYNAIFEYNPTDVNDHWKSYNPYLPNGTVQQLNSMDRISGYWVYMFNDVDFNYAGIYSDSTVYLYKGWNLIGYPSKQNSSINASLVGVPFTVVKYYNTTSDFWSVYYKNDLNNSFNQFETYKGYWVNVSSNSQWNIFIG